MCCFSGEVRSVDHTHIFARSSREGRQFLAYEMKFSAKEDLAMILPIPVPPASAEDAVRFISLKEYPTFFADLDSGFPKPKAVPKAEEERPAAAPRALAVVEVGAFEASFVPSLKDFSRLDERFRLPDAVWGQLPLYKSFGFAVFKLKKGERSVHPMAFEFPRQAPARLFFPTVHIHDGKVHEKAEFDHELYCQKGKDETFQVFTWDESPGHATGFMKVDKAAGLIDPGAHVYKHTIYGEKKNEDTIL